MVASPAGLYRPFLKREGVQRRRAGGDVGAPDRRVSDRCRAGDQRSSSSSSSIAHPQWRKSQIKASLRRGAVSQALAVRSRTGRCPGGATSRSPTSRGSLPKPIARRAASGCRRQTNGNMRSPTMVAARTELRERSLEWFARTEQRPPARDRGRGRQRLWRRATWSASCGNGRSISTPTRLRNRAINGGAFSCSGAAARAADPTDYPAFMRYSMRESLKANYTADNLGFRCAGGAP